MNDNLTDNGGASEDADVVDDLDQDTGRVTAHIRNMGDVTGKLGDWIGRRGSRLWVEGFSLMPPDAISPEELEYQTSFDRTWRSPWYAAGRFCGSRGFGLPLYGIAARLRGQSAKNYDVHCAATFLDGTRRDVTDETLCVASSGAPLEAFTIILTSRDGRVVKSAPPHRTYRSTTARSITAIHPLAQLRDVPFSRAILASAGSMIMPPCRVLNPPSRPDLVSRLKAYDPLLTWDGGPDEIFPRRIEYPEMWVARLEHAQMWPYAPPFLPASRTLVNDFLIPWAQDVVGWFDSEGEGVYQLPYNLLDSRWVDTGFYMGHSISGHFGHFIGDCLCRMHAWRACKQLFGDVKVLLEHSMEDAGFRIPLLVAAGVPIEDIVFLREPTYCRTLLIASPALSVQRYVSPSAMPVWKQIRDSLSDKCLAGRGDKIYLSRAGQPLRKLVNEPQVEQLFAQYGFQIVRPEGLSVAEQVAMISEADIVAGTGGSAMFNLAFQARLRSVMWIVPDTFVQITEWFFLAGTQCPAFYHLGSRDLVQRTPSDPHDLWGVEMTRLAADVETWLTSLS